MEQLQQFLQGLDCPRLERYQTLQMRCCPHQFRHLDVDAKLSEELSLFGLCLSEFCFLGVD